MIPFNAALVEEYWERLLGRRLEPRQVVGLEPPSERRSVEQPEYLGELLRHLRRHPAPITATRPTGTVTDPMDFRPIGILLMDTMGTHQWPTDTQAIRLVPVTSLPRPMATMAMRGTPITQVRRAMNTTAMLGTPLIPVPRAMDHLATWDTRLTPTRRATNTTATRGTPLILVPRAMDHLAT